MALCMLVGVLGMAVPVSRPASAQVSYGALPSDRQKEYVALGKSCRSEAARFCPNVDSLQLHNLAICLKPYRSNLSLGCRASLKSVSTAATAQPGAE